MNIKIKNTIKMIINIIMLLIMISLMNKNFTGMKAHEIFGIILFILFFIHKIINIKTIKVFCKNLFNKNFKVENKVLFILDILLFVVIIGIITTGILISNNLFKGIFIGNRSIIKKIHIFLSWWSLILISIHIGFHLKTIIIYLKNKKTIQTMKCTL